MYLFFMQRRCQYDYMASNYRIVSGFGKIWEEPVVIQLETLSLRLC
jgi:hypothetical protein